MDAGMTFFLVEDQKILDTHLWVIVSDPHVFPDQVVIVSVTTLKDHKNQACILKRGCHPCITHASCIAYNMAKVVPLAKLLECKGAGLIRLQEPASANLRELIRNRAGDSTLMDPDIADIPHRARHYSSRRLMALCQNRRRTPCDHPLFPHCMILTEAGLVG